MQSQSQTIVLIDGANLNASINEMNKHLDFNLLHAWLTSTMHYPIIQYYTALYADKENSGHIEIQKLCDYLSYNGYRLITKSAKKFGDVIKGNMDIEIAVDAIEFALNGMRELVLFSGDGDFIPLLTFLQRRGIKVTVVSTLNITANELRKQSDVYIDLNKLCDAGFIAKR